MVIEDVSDEGPQDPVPMLGLKSHPDFLIIKLMHALTRREGQEELGTLELIIGISTAVRGSGTGGSGNRAGSFHHHFWAAEEIVIHVGSKWRQESRTLRHKTKELTQMFLPETRGKVTFGVVEGEAPFTPELIRDLEGNLFRAPLEGPWTQHGSTDQDRPLKQVWELGNFSK